MGAVRKSKNEVRQRTTINYRKFNVRLTLRNGLGMLNANKCGGIAPPGNQGYPSAGVKKCAKMTDRFYGCSTHTQALTRIREYALAEIYRYFGGSVLYNGREQLQNVSVRAQRIVLVKLKVIIVATGKCNTNRLTQPHTDRRIRVYLPASHHPDYVPFLSVPEY